MNGSAFVSGGETAKVLHASEASLDAVSVRVDGLIMFDDDLSRSV